MIRTLFVASTLALLAAPAMADPSCPGEGAMLPMNQIAKTFEDQGGKIKVMKETKGGCYEIYGYEGELKVEMHIDPRTGAVVERAEG